MTPARNAIGVAGVFGLFSGRIDPHLMAMRNLAFLALAATLIGLAAPAIAQQRGATPAPAAPGKTPTYGDWQYVCEPARQGRGEVCTLRQFVAPKDRPGQPILAVAIGRLTPDRKMTIVFKLPPQIDKTAGIGFRVDDDKFITVPVATCDAGACTAALGLDESTLKKLRAGKQAMVAFRSAEGVAGGLPVSLSGISRGLAALK